MKTLKVKLGRSSLEVCRDLQPSWPSLVSYIIKWFSTMEEHEKVVRITFQDFRKAFDLIDHNRLLQNCDKIGIRPAVMDWLASYLQRRSQVTKFENVLSDSVQVKGGVCPEAAKLVPLPS